MTREEAIEILEANRPDPCYQMLREAVDFAVDALEKQIPMKTMPPELGISPRHPIIIPCGNCGMELEDRMWEYCPWCGQAINWRTKDD